MVNYLETLKYPFSDKKSFLIGFLMSVFWWLIVPMFFVFGYVVESIREILQNSNKLPHWFTVENWKTFLIHGLNVTLIGLVYLVPPIALSMASTAIMGDITLAVFTGEMPQFNAIGITLFAFGFLLLLIAIFFLPISIILYAASENIRYAFSLTEILPRLKRVILPYAQAYFISIVLFFAILLFLLIPGINLFFGVIMGGLFFYHFMFTFRLFAEIFRDYGL